MGPRVTSAGSYLPPGNYPKPRPWPDYETICRSLAARGNLAAALDDDPLPYTVITDVMLGRALDYEFGK